jgi:hypothetical protein
MVACTEKKSGACFFQNVLETSLFIAFLFVESKEGVIASGSRVGSQPIQAEVVEVEEVRLKKVEKRAGWECLRMVC